MISPPGDLLAVLGLTCHKMKSEVAPDLVLSTVGLAGREGGTTTEPCTISEYAEEPLGLMAIVLNL